MRRKATMKFGWTKSMPPRPFATERVLGKDLPFQAHVPFSAQTDSACYRQTGQVIPHLSAILKKNPVALTGPSLVPGTNPFISSIINKTK
ncbi:hypothetical protein [Paludibacterium paludis]|uniref:hypothetical protein n=1 Tax=Paludibacterium paludis TaxID=1225769 RepID=UPI0016765D47|nr:hypothetical protein [Paludibacterium paludis]